METYHFVPGNKLYFLDKIKEFLHKKEFNVILDLEDAVSDFTNSVKNREIKSRARKEIIKYFKTNHPKGNYLLRINNPLTIFLSEDIKVAKELYSLKNLKGLIVPKADLKSLEIIFNKIPFIKEIKIYPLIETFKGLKELEKICSNFKIYGIIFGHHDYFYDKKVFPIPKSAITSEKYRGVMRRIYDLASKFNLEYIDGIYPLLNDYSGLKNNLNYLYSFGKAKVGKLSVHKNQIKEILNFVKSKGNTFLNNEDEEMSKNEKIQEAKRIVEIYKNRNRISGVTKSNENMYISPQMYLISKQYLKEN